MTLNISRRQFAAMLGGAAAWPVAARAQDERVRRIGFLSGSSETDRVVGVPRTMLREGLEKLGWIEGRNARFDVRFSAGDPDRLQVYADDLVRSAPDAIAVTGSAATRTLLQRTRTIPIVFINVGDPVAGGC